MAPSDGDHGRRHTTTIVHHDAVINRHTTALDGIRNHRASGAVIAADGAVGQGQPALTQPPIDQSVSHGANGLTR